MGAEVFSVPQVTVTVPLPALVVWSIAQVHDATPSGPVIFEVSPRAVLTFPEGWM